MKLCQDIPLSRRTITRRTEDINESTDINNICQLIICIKTVNANLECFEEMFEVVSLHGHVTGQVLYDALDVNVFAFADKNKLASICSDGAKVMRGKNKGLLGILNKNGINCPAFHCVIHQQALFSKELEIRTTYNCEVAFSSMKLILSKLRNRLTDQHIGDLLRIKEYKGNIDLDRLVEL
ncbi:SCAN domain-containing protein 3-like [Lucilia cuprina]|uniref:SCAN domain-containing protein 3-like n=1 Tax=Lucilia cuprina TaxID=7375 RepID=UPI001F0508D9|nr:SCAN domain-containing protein 3-like [Lucilia cuprina]